MITIGNLCLDDEIKKADKSYKRVLKAYKTIAEYYKSQGIGIRAERYTNRFDLIITFTDCIG